MNLAKDRILQGRFFIDEAYKLGFSNPDGFRYYVEAAIVAARSVTLLLQKQYSRFYGFRDWYEKQQDNLKKDKLSRYLLEKRNFVLKEGLVSIRKHITIEITETVFATASFSAKVVGGSFKRKIRNSILNIKDTIKEMISKIKQKRELKKKKKEESKTKITEAYYFVDKDYDNKPVLTLLKEQFDTLELIVDDAIAKFDKTPMETNGS